MGDTATLSGQEVCLPSGESLGAGGASSRSSGDILVRFWHFWRVSSYVGRCCCSCGSGGAPFVTAEAASSCCCFFSKKLLSTLGFLLTCGFSTGAGRWGCGLVNCCGATAAAGLWWIWTCCCCGGGGGGDEDDGGGGGLGGGGSGGCTLGL